MIQRGHRFLALLIVGVSLFFFTPPWCYAQNPIEELEKALERVIDIILGVGGGIGIILIIIGGMRYIASGGDPRSIASAKKMIVMAVLGVILVLGASAVLDLVIRALKSTP